MARIRWTPSYRVVPSRFPPVGLFDRVARLEDLEYVLAAEQLTNDRLRDEARDLQLVSPEERVSGPGTTPIMAAFTHLNREGSRFSDGTFGVYYAAKDLATAVTESAFHRARFLARTAEAAGEVDMRIYLSDVRGDFVDLRAAVKGKAQLLDPDSYRASQAYAVARRGEGAGGIVYPSVRKAGGECVAVFRPKLLAPCRQGPHLGYIWDGRAITGWYEKGAVRNV